MKESKGYKNVTSIKQSHLGFEREIIIMKTRTIRSNCNDLFPKHKEFKELLSELLSESPYNVVKSWACAGPSHSPY